MPNKTKTLCLLTILSAAFWASSLQAAPITDKSFFTTNPEPHILIPFDQLGDGSQIFQSPGQPLLLPGTEHLGQGVTFEPSITILTHGNRCIKILVSFSGTGQFIGMSLGDTTAMVFDPPVSAFGFWFVLEADFPATFTALDAAGGVIETVTSGGIFVDGSSVCSQASIFTKTMEFGFMGISSTTPIHRVEFDVVIDGGLPVILDNLRFIQTAANPDSDGDGVPDDSDNCPAVANPGQEDFDGDGLGDACDPDDDNDGLDDVDELALGTDPFNPDTDGDGLLDGTEVDSSMGTGCPDPTVADSDGDTLSDGDEVLTLGTDPCSADTDGDGVADNLDPLPTEPGVTSGFLEDFTRQESADIQALDLGVFNGPNNNANKGRQNSLANRAMAAAALIAEGDLQGAIDELTSLLEKIDGESPPPDWMDDSPEKTALADDVSLLIALLLFSL